MSASAASCMAVLNQQREQMVQHHGHGDEGTIAPCQALSCNCTIVENGQVVVRPIQVKPIQPPADALPAS